MRLISQNGTCDVPYDSYALSIRESICSPPSLGDRKNEVIKKGIFISAIDQNGGIINMGIYNSFNEAKEILERVRKNATRNKIYFQFPK